MLYQMYILYTGPFLNLIRHLWFPSAKLGLIFYEFMKQSISFIPYKKLKQNVSSWYIMVILKLTLD